MRFRLIKTGLAFFLLKTCFIAIPEKIKIIPHNMLSPCTPLDITFLSPIFQILLGFCYHTMVYFDIIESALTPAFTWSKVPRPRRPTIPLTGDKAPPAWTGRNLINRVPPKGPISYLFIYLFNQTLPGTHYCTSKIFSHFTL